jgi:hypothetical protein
MEFIGMLMMLLGAGALLDEWMQKSRYPSDDDAARKADEEFSKRKREARGNAHPRDVFKGGKWRRWKGSD